MPGFKLIHGKHRESNHFVFIQKKKVGTLLKTQLLPAIILWQSLTSSAIFIKGVNFSTRKQCLPVKNKMST
jgi:hypothetical protein